MWISARTVLRATIAMTAHTTSKTPALLGFTACLAHTSPSRRALNVQAAITVLQERNFPLLVLMANTRSSALKARMTALNVSLAITASATFRHPP